MAVKDILKNPSDKTSRLLASMFIAFGVKPLYEDEYGWIFDIRDSKEAITFYENYTKTKYEHGEPVHAGKYLMSDEQFEEWRIYVTRRRPYEGLNGTESHNIDESTCEAIRIVLAGEEGVLYNWQQHDITLLDYESLLQMISHSYTPKGYVLPGSKYVAEIDLKLGGHDGLLAATGLYECGQTNVVGVSDGVVAHWNWFRISESFSISVSSIQYWEELINLLLERAFLYEERHSNFYIDHYLVKNNRVFLKTYDFLDSDAKNADYKIANLLAMFEGRLKYTEVRADNPDICVKGALNSVSDIDMNVLIDKCLQT